MNFETFADNTSGSSALGLPDPERIQMLLPPPSAANLVRVPLYAAIQADGPASVIVNGVTYEFPFISCHGILRASPAVDGWRLLPTTVILWSIKLTAPVLRGGEFFVPVGAFPLPAGWEILASWSYATGHFALRSRTVSVEVPAETFDWSQARPLPLQPQQTTV